MDSGTASELSGSEVLPHPPLPASSGSEPIKCPRPECSLRVVTVPSEGSQRGTPRFPHLHTSDPHTPAGSVSGFQRPRRSWSEEPTPRHRHAITFAGTSCVISAANSGVFQFVADTKSGCLSPPPDVEEPLDVSLSCVAAQSLLRLHRSPRSAPAFRRRHVFSRNVMICDEDAEKHGVVRATEGHLQHPEVLSRCAATASTVIRQQVAQRVEVPAEDDLDVVVMEPIVRRGDKSTRSLRPSAEATQHSRRAGWGSDHLSDSDDEFELVATSVSNYSRSGRRQLEGSQRPQRPSTAL